MITYTLIRSRRKTISLEIQADGTVLVRAPAWAMKNRIDEFVLQKEGWIRQKLGNLSQRDPIRTVSASEREQIRARAESLLPQRLAFWSKKTGLSYQGLQITSAEKRFGSCNGKNHICLSLYLADYPEELVDYVIVHELCHTVEHNHSPRFYALVEKFLPDWREREKRLKQLPLPHVEKT